MGALGVAYIRVRNEQGNGLILDWNEHLFLQQPGRKSMPNLFIHHQVFFLTHHLPCPTFILGPFPALDRP